MKVKVGTRTYDAEIEPVMVILTDHDKALIAAMAPQAHRYCAYPKGIDPGTIGRWMNDDTDERCTCAKVTEFASLFASNSPCPVHGPARDNSAPRGAQEGTPCRP